jgi:hypothetical protein
MLNLSVQTRLNLRKSLTRIEEYFIKKSKLTLIESVAHMHAKNGSAEIRMYGDPLNEKNSYQERAHIRFKTCVLPVSFSHISW